MRNILAAGCAALLVLAANASAAIGDLYVTTNTSSTTNGSVVRITPAGSVSIFASGLSRPYGIAVDILGNVYTSDITGGTITKISPLGVATVFATGLSGPRGMGFDLGGNLIVATTQTLTKITPDGSISTLDTGFSSAWDVTFSSSGLMYVTDLGTRQVLQYNALGGKSVLATADNGSATVYSLAFANPNALIVTQGPSQTILKVGLDGSKSVFIDDTNPDTFLQATGVDVNSAGEIFVGSLGTVYKYTPDGTSRSTVASNLGSNGLMAIMVPEPSTGLLSLFGVTLALGLRRRRKG